MLTKIEDLRTGDEFITPMNGKFMYIRVVRPAHVINKRDKTTGIITPKLDYHTNTPVYSSIRGTTRVDKITYSRTSYNGVITYTKDEYICSSEGHNIEKYFQLNYKSIWLVKRGI